jgi:hypothetical protein
MGGLLDLACSPRFASEMHFSGNPAALRRPRPPRPESLPSGRGETPLLVGSNAQPQVTELEDVPAPEHPSKSATTSSS